MADTGIILRRGSKASLIVDPPRTGEMVFAVDTGEHGWLNPSEILVWKNLETDNDTSYDDTALAAAVALNTAKVSNVDHPLVETAVPSGAVFTDTIYDDSALAAAVALNTAKVSNVDHPLVETAVPSGAVFTDTVYDDTSLSAAVALNTADIAAIEDNDSPVGGTTGQLLAKASDTDRDVNWIDAPSADPIVFTYRVGAAAAPSEAAHRHTVILRLSDYTAIINGEDISITSDLVDGHTHDVTFSYIESTYSIVVTDITNNVTDHHRCVLVEGEKGAARTQMVQTETATTNPHFYDNEYYLFDLNQRLSTIIKYEILIYDKVDKFKTTAHGLLFLVDRTQMTYNNTYASPIEEKRNDNPLATLDNVRVVQDEVLSETHSNNWHWRVRDKDDGTNNVELYLHSNSNNNNSYITIVYETLLSEKLIMDSGTLAYKDPAPE